MTYVIAFQSPNDIQLYLNKFYLLLYNYQLINKLCINSDKTQLMICHQPKHNDFLKDFFFMAKDDKIENSNSLKILGFVLRYNLDNETQIGNLCASLHNRLHNIKKLLKYTNFTTRLQFVNAIVIGKLLYSLPIYTQLTKAQLNKIHRVI